MRCARCRKLVFGTIIGRKFCNACEALVASEQARQNAISETAFKRLRHLLLTRQFTRQSARNVLDRARRDGLLSDGDVKKRVYEFAAAQIVNDRLVTKEEKETLAGIKEYLAIPDSDVLKTDLDLVRRELMWELEKGHLGQIANPGIPMQGNEIAHIVFDEVDFHQERVVKTEYVGGSRGVSIRIMKGVSYRVGGHRGQRVSTTALVQIDTGRVVLTSKRFVFSGTSKAFSIPAKKVLSYTPYADGASIVKDSIAVSNKPYVFTVDDAELFNVALSAWMNNI